MKDLPSTFGRATALPAYNSQINSIPHLPCYSYKENKKALFGILKQKTLLVMRNVFRYIKGKLYGCFICLFNLLTS